MTGMRQATVRGSTPKGSIPLRDLRYSFPMMQFWILPVTGGLCSCLKMSRPGFQHHFWVPYSPARKMPQQDLLHTFIGRAWLQRWKRSEPQNWCCLYRPRRGMSHTRLVMLSVPHLHVHTRLVYAFSTSFTCLIYISTHDWSCIQYLIYMPRARQWLGKKLYCTCAHWLFTHIHGRQLIEISAPSCNGVYWLPTVVQEDSLFGE